MPVSSRYLLRSPLVHFALSGALLFVLWEWRGRAVADDSVIEVSATRAATLTDSFVEQRGREPTVEEQRSLYMVAADSELLIREAKRLGFENYDPIIQRRLAQKMRFAIEDANTLDEPSEAELLAYLEAHAQTYVRPAKIDLTHVFLDGTADDGRVVRVGEQLRAGVSPAKLGDAFGHGAQLRDRSVADLTRVFGAKAASSLKLDKTGRWQRMPSTYGVHWVRVEAYRPERAQALNEVRAKVTEAWRRERRDLAFARELDLLRANYRVELPSSADVDAARRARGTRTQTDER